MPSRDTNAGMPRSAEFILAFILLLLSLPILLVVSLLVAVTSGFPILFRQERVGLLGRRFMLLKFRSMSVSNRGPEITLSGDSRITPIGRILRRAKLDELPQLWNVLVADLALVGPRPEVPRYVDTDNKFWQEVLRARPGIVDPVTLVLRNEESLLASAGDDPEKWYREHLLPFKLTGYLKYLRSRTWRTDFEVLFQSVIAVIGVFQNTASDISDLKMDVGLEATTKRFDASKSSFAAFPQRLSARSEQLFGFLPSKLARFFQFAADLLVLMSSFVLAYLLRFDFSIPANEVVNLLWQLPVVVLIQSTFHSLFRLNRVLWRYLTLADVRVFIKASLWAAIPLLVARLTLPDSLQFWRFPIAVIAIDTMLVAGGLLGIRMLRRSIHRGQSTAHRVESTHAVRRERILLIGAGEAGRMAAQELRERSSRDVEVIGFVDDDPRKQCGVISGIDVIGNVDSLPVIAKVLAIDSAVITIQQVSREQLERILSVCEKIPLRTRLLPPIQEFLQGRINLEGFRDIDISELLRRPQVFLDRTARENLFASKSVMITGAGGSIGSELARQVCKLSPSRVLLVERSEFALFTIHRELIQAYPHHDLTPVLADVGDNRRMRQVFAKETPEIVIHAAAHKHVPMIEDNPSECITNNVFGTHTLGKIAGESGVQTFVLISTDKAVRPTSLMGASKRVTELIIQSLNQQYDTMYMAVRFGNVIGSTGSVIPTFREQIRGGGPVTITHPDMMRYFMTIPEAASLVLEAATFGLGGEIFVLDMGEPVRILDLAKDLIVLSGKTPYEDIDIVTTGMRPGEKLNEELELDNENMTRTRHQKIFIGTIESCTPQRLESCLRDLEALIDRGEDGGIRLLLATIIPESNLLIPKRPSPQPSGASIAAVAGGGLG